MSKRAPRNSPSRQRPRHETLLLGTTLLAVVRSSAAQFTTPVTLEGRVVLRVADGIDAAPVYYWPLLQDDGQMVSLAWGNVTGKPPTGIKPWMRLQVQGFTRQASGPRVSAAGAGNGTPGPVVLVVDGVTVLDQAVAKAATKTAALLQQNIKVMILMHDFSECDPDGGAFYTEAEVQKWFFEETSGGALSVESQLRACTYGAIQLDPTYHKVVIVKIPQDKCNFWDAASKQGYVSNDCPYGYAVDLLYEQVEIAAAQQGHDLRSYKNRWHVLSKGQSQGDNCWYSGLADFACAFDDATAPGRPCRLLVAPGKAADELPHLWLHEAGHLFGLGHAGAGGNEFADESCMMGGWGDWPHNRCYNLPHAVTLGIAQPTAVQESNLVGRWKQFSLRAADATNTGGLQIRTATKAADQPPSNDAYIDAYLSYRRKGQLYPDFKNGGGKVAGSGDTDLMEQYNGVLLHLYPDPRAGAGDRTSLEGRALTGGVISDPLSGLVVRVLAQAGDAVQVNVCRRSEANAGGWATEDACGNGLDDDCDGVFDGGCPGASVAVCGDSVCSAGETRRTCFADCCKPQGKRCRKHGVCCSRTCKKRKGKKKGKCL